MASDNSLRDHLLYLLNGDGAHIDFESVIKDLPANLRGKKPAGAAHTPWQLVEHLRITQRDVLESIRNSKHVSPEFPAGYWPASEAPATGKDWEKSVDAFRADHRTLAEMVANSNGLLTPISHSDGQTIFRKLAMLADHNAYHLGQLVVVRRILGAWQ
ncbi:MAG TPA: DinB family protein [Candidatus Angelobacter sp.]|nr:DinB family protein [Candidatus Angelobacter sp.]